MIHLHIHPSFYKFKKLEKQTSVIEYTVAGFLIVTVDYLVFIGLFNNLKAGLFVSTIVAYIAGFITGYFLNRYWVFRKTAKKADSEVEFMRYMVLVIFNLGLTYGVLWFLQNAGLTPLIGKIIVYVGLYFWVYFISRFWVFK